MKSALHQLKSVDLWTTTAKDKSPLYSGKFQKVLNKIPEDINHKLTMLNKHRAQNTDVGDAVLGTKTFKDIETSA